MVFIKRPIGFSQASSLDKNPLIQDPNTFLGGLKIYATRSVLYNVHPEFLKINSTLIYIISGTNGNPELLEYTSVPATIPSVGPYTSGTNFTSSLLFDGLGINAIQANTTTQTYRHNLNFVGPYFNISDNPGNDSIDISLNLLEAHITNLGTNITLNTDTDASEKAWVIDENTMLSNSATKVPTQRSVKAYVDAYVASPTNYVGGYDAATNTPDLDTTPGSIAKGSMYTVTVAGNFFATPVDVGDVLIAEIANPATVDDWTIVNKDLDSSSVKALYEANTIFQLDNFQIDGNILSSTNSNGNIEFSPNGSGVLVTTASLTTTVPNLNIGTNAIPFNNLYVNTINLGDSDDVSTTSWSINTTGGASIQRILLNPTGTGTVRVPLNYEDNVSDGRDLINKAYFDANTPLGGAVNSIALTPTTTIDALNSSTGPGAGQHNYALVWNNSVGEYVLSLIGGAGGGIANLADSGGNVINTVTGTGYLQWENLRLDGNTISSVDTNGPITVSPDGTGVFRVKMTSSPTFYNTFTGALTADRTTTFPDKSGTVAFFDDIPILTSQQVAYADVDGSLIGGGLTYSGEILTVGGGSTPTFRVGSTDRSSASTRTTALNSSGFFSLRASTSAGQDSGAVAPIRFQSDHNGAATLGTRPTLAGYNYTTKQWEVSAGGDWDYQGNNLTGIALLTLSGTDRVANLSYSSNNYSYTGTSSTNNALIETFSIANSDNGAGTPGAVLRSRFLGGGPNSSVANRPILWEVNNGTVLDLWTVDVNGTWDFQANTLSNIGQLNASQVNVDNLRLDGNSIISTDTNGNITLDPNGSGDVTIPSGDLVVSGSGARIIGPTIYASNGGSVSQAAFYINNDINTGLYSGFADMIGMTAGGVNVMEWESTGVNIPNGNLEFAGTERISSSGAGSFLSINVGSGSAIISSIGEALLGTLECGSATFSGSVDFATNITIGLKDALRVAEVTLTPAQIASLHTTPITIIAAPGAGNWIAVQRVQITKDYNSVAYNAATLIVAAYNGFANHEYVNDSGVLPGTSDRKNSVSINTVDPADSPENIQVIVRTSGSAGASGNSNIRVKIWYTIEAIA